MIVNYANMVAYPGRSAITTIENNNLRSKYQVTSLFYDWLDFPWERQYRKWRPIILKEVKGDVLEAGIGTGRNLAHYPPDVSLTAIDLSPGMIQQAQKRAPLSSCSVTLQEADAADLRSFTSNCFDWYIATFLYCVMPDVIQPLAIQEMARVLKPGGRFCLLEIVYSKNRWICLRQKCIAPFVRFVYGAQFDRSTLDHIAQIPSLQVTETRYLKDDTYLLIQGKKTIA
ncbi:MAG: class I SAM-dependent methyltransferase [Nitrospirota bacterium]